MSQTQTIVEGGWYKLEEDTNQPIPMSKNIKGAAKYINKEIEDLRNTVLIETLKESSAKENRERSEKRIEELQQQLAVLNANL